MSFINCVGGYMNLETVHYSGLDVGKFIMAVLVIAIHTHPMADCSNAFLIFLYTNLSFLAVPFFFVTTSWLFFIRENDIYSEKCRENLKKRIFHFIMLYILWEIIYLPCVLIGYYRNGYSAVFNILDYIRKLIFVGSNYYSSQFWFLLSLIYTLIILLFLLKMKLPLNRIFMISSLFYIIGLTINHLIEIRPDDASGILWLSISYISSLCNESSVLPWFIYVVLGMIMAKRHILLSKSKIAVFFAIGILGRAMFFQWYLLYYIAALFEVIAVFQLFLQLRLEDKYIYRKCRESSMVLYYTHFYFIFFYELVFQDLSQSGIKLFTTCLLCCVALSGLVIRLKQYYPCRWLKRLFG